MTELTAIDALRIAGHVTRFAEIGPREDGTKADHLAVRYLESELVSYGLEVHRQPIDCLVVEPIETELTITKPKGTVIQSIHGNLSGLTGPAGITGEVAFVNKGFEDDYEGRNVKGKIVLAWQERYWESGDQPRRKMARAAKHGAIGFLFAMKRRDDLITPWGLGREVGPIPFVSISYLDYLAIREMMQDEVVEATLRVIGEPKRGQSINVWSLVRGTEMPDEIIGLGSCHHETVPLCPGANDNGSGMAWLLELARFFSRFPQKRSVLIFINGGEEGGLWGARAFAENQESLLGSPLQSMLMVDQIGGMSPMIYSGGTRWLERMWIDAALRLGHRLTHCFDKLIVTELGSLGDALPFVQAGVPTAVAGAWPSDFFYHTVMDTPDKVCANGVKMLAESAASLVMQLASK